MTAKELEEAIEDAMLNQTLQGAVLEISALAQVYAKDKVVAALEKVERIEEIEDNYDKPKITCAKVLSIGIVIGAGLAVLLITVIGYIIT